MQSLKRCKWNLCQNIPQVIAAKGEQKASGALRAAAETMEQAPAALQLRFLQVSHGLDVTLLVWIRQFAIFLSFLDELDHFML